MATTTVSPAETPESVNSIGRIFGVLFSPKATFASIARRPTWFLPLLLITLVSIGAAVLIGQRIGWRAVIEQQVAKNPAAQRQLEQLTPQQRQQALEAQMKYVGIAVYVASVAGPAIIILVVAAALLGLFNLVGGVSMRFATSVGIVAYAWMPRVIYGLLAIVILFLKDPQTVDVQNIVASNPAVFLSDGAASWLVMLLGALDLFSFWAMLLLAVGYSAVNPKKLSFAKAFAVIFGIWLVIVLARVGLAAVFS